MNGMGHILKRRFHLRTNMDKDSRMINGRLYVYDRGVWIPLTEKLTEETQFLLFTEETELGRIDKTDLIRIIADKSNTIAELSNTISSMREKLNRVAETNNRLGFELERLQKEIKDLKSENEKLSTVDKMDFYMRYQYPEDCISPNYSIRKQAAAIKKIYEERNAQASDRFSEIKLGTEQHRDNTPEEMIDTFTGIYDIWEKHPELELMELLAKLINSRKGCVPIDDEEFIKALKEIYNE